VACVAKLDNAIRKPRRVRMDDDPAAQSRVATTDWPDRRHRLTPTDLADLADLLTRSDAIMRILVNVHIPHEPFNTLVRDGRAGAVISQIVEECKPEVIYFTEQSRKRGAVLVVDIAEPSDLPSIAEPWFLKFNAECEFRLAMKPEDLQKAGLDKLGAKWK
jgi:hypothetical protein